MLWLGPTFGNWTSDELYRNEFSTGANVSTDSNPHVCVIGVASRILDKRGVREIALFGSGSARHRDLLLGLASVSTDTVCRAPGRARGDLATQAPAHTT